MKASTVGKVTLLSVAIAATFLLLVAQDRNISTDIASFFSLATSSQVESGAENIMPDAMLDHIQQERQQQKRHDSVVPESEADDMTGTSTESSESTDADQDDEDESEPSVLATYIKVVDACGPYYEGECLNVRSGPSVSSGIQAKLRNGQVLKVEELVVAEERRWYKVVFDEWLRHPERLEGDWYVAADYVEAIESETIDEPETSASSTKRIVINLSEQKLYAYDGDEIYMEEDVSTGTIGAVTPRGTFTVFYRTPSRYMQGPIPGITDDDYDLPGVPWNLYFTEQGAVIHGAYWHDNFGMNWSHGCVNLPPEKAMQLYAWTPEGTQVVVRD